MGFDQAATADGRAALMAVPTSVRPQTVIAMAISIGLVMSTQFLAQPFVWRNWPFDDIFYGWLRIAGDRMIVASTIAASVSLGLSSGLSSTRAGPWLLGLSIIAGSVAGEYGRSVIDPFGDHLDGWSRIGRIAQWSAVAGAVAGIAFAWRSASAAALAVDEAELRRLANRRAATQAELESLQRQIEPHFLFNTLATVQRLGRTAPQQGLQLLTRLFDFITANLNSEGSELSTIGTELDLARAYLDVCRARMGPRLTVEWDIDQALRAHPFPRYLLGTLIENAIKHGISPKSEDGVVAIAVTREDDRVVVRVSDTGDGLTGSSGSGIGLANLVARLRLLYDGRADFTLRPGPTNGMTARVRVPFHGSSGDD